MPVATKSTRLDIPIDRSVDHFLGPENAAVELVEYGSYACPHCRAANERVADIRDEFAERLLYVFRHRPLPGSDLAEKAALLVERARTPDEFWRAHVLLMTRSTVLTDDDLRVVSAELEIDRNDADAAERAKRRVARDRASAAASRVSFTPSFFINGRRYDGPWDSASFIDELRGSLGQRLHNAALDFARWAPSTGALLLLATLAAVALANSPWSSAFAQLWSLPFSIGFSGAALEFPLIHWLNDGLLAVFFLVLGLEVKREFTIGRLSGLKTAALPIAAAIGGMAVPALVYLLLIPHGAWSIGFGVPMATDTAFAVALIALLGRRAPIELRIFLTAAAVVDDIGAIIVVALFYTEQINISYLTAAMVITSLLALLSRFGAYRFGLAPYTVLGLALWFCVHESGLHAVLAGILLAFFIPTRPPANLAALMTQAGAIVAANAMKTDDVLRHRLPSRALRALDAIHDRLESPADRLLRSVEPWSSYFVLPLFALANAGVMINLSVLAAHVPLTTAIFAGLVIGKPVGMVTISALAVWLGIASKPDAYSWTQLGGAGAVAGVGFTMSLFIADQAFARAETLDAAKIAIFGASLISALAGLAILLAASSRAHNR